jgi:predicted Zn-dependent protease
MRRWFPLALIVIAGLAALIAAQYQRVRTQPSPQAILSTVADAEREVARVPAHLDHMSDAEEIAVGSALAQSYESAWKLDQQSEAAKRVEAYLQTVGALVAGHATRKLPYRFHYVARPSFVNAFALPGGHVFVGEGLLKLVQSEDALAAVIGHEVEHVDLRHCAERAETEANLRHLGLAGDLLSLPVNVFTASYSKDQELEADRYGTALAVDASYSPEGILQLLDAFGRLEGKAEHGADRSGSPIDEATQVSLETLQGYLRSHPPAAERKEQIEHLMRSERWPKPTLRPLGL